ncbi:DUF3429 domain-containing protein [Caulobacter sp. BP25]|uniref:DUF3429 domain-containing protein n=1 Tax=Caulobacter sp. BP25 TaxID=2048900 RepID=UPI000C12B50B|nr:DUF3429 domain-containing protein [Caulobacter sp. BP25]PHY17598.1 DUF3429 domain-containing protein [Caulobacter sp. BP25]
MSRVEGVGQERSQAQLMTALGALGLIPFLAPPVLRIDWFEPILAWSSLQIIYGAAILSFLGGVRAAQAVFSDDCRADTLILAMAPPLVGWVLAAIGVMGQTEPRLAADALLGMAAALAAQGVWDVTSSALPEWYRQLRLPLTAMACIGLVIGAAVVGG